MSEMSQPAAPDARPSEVMIAPRGRISAWGDKLGDFLNPVLVKEIRQAQRGKVFSIALITIVLITLLACTFMAIEVDIQSTRQGREFFTLVYVFLCSAVLLVVPFQAFTSMGTEWDDHTYEMLVLSNLKPGQIVLGKIYAAILQGGLLLAAFLPFLAVAFLLRGVDLLVLAVALALTMFACAWLSTVSIMLSTLTRNRFLRVLLMVALAGGLVVVITGAVASSTELMQSPDIVTGSEFWTFVPQVLVIATFVGLLAFFISCNLLAHEEENRSTNIRILATVGLVAYMIMMAVNVSLASTAFPKEAVFATASAMAFFLALLSIYFCSEPDRLGRRVAPTVPKGRIAAFLTMPWFPGAGRGAAYLLLHLLGLTLGAFVIAAMAPDMFPGGSVRRSNAESLMESGGVALVVSLNYVLLYTLVPIGVMLTFLGNKKRHRKMIRALAIFSPLFYILVPGIIGMMVEDSAREELLVIGNPGMMISEAMDGRLWQLSGFVLIMVPMAILGILMCLPRLFKAMAETAMASAGRVAPPDESTIEPTSTGS